MIVHQHNKSRLDKAAFIMLAHLQSLGAVLYFQKLTLFIAVEPVCSLQRPLKQKMMKLQFHHLL